MATNRSDVEIGISGDAKDLQKTLQGAEAALSDFARDVKAKLSKVDALQGLQATLAKTGAELEAAKAKVRGLADELAASANPTRALQAGYREAVTAAQGLERQFISQQKQAKALGTQLVEAGVDTSKLRSEQTRLATEVVRTNAAIDAELKRTRARRRTSDARDILGLPDPRENDQEVARIQAALKRLQATGRLDGAQQVAAIEAARAKIAQLRGETETGTAKITRGLTSLKSAFLALGATAVVRSIVDATVDAERSQTLLAARLRSTGRESEFTTEELNKMSEELQAISTFDDDGIDRLRTALLGFRNVAKDVFQETSKAAIDFAASTNQDLATAAETIGQIVDQPLSASKKLKAIGVNLSDAEQRLIRRFVESGDAAAAQRVILEQLQRVYGGTASAAKDTFGGALADLKKTLSNLLEGGGGSLTSAKEGVQDLTKALTDPATQQGISALINGIIELLGVLAQAGAGFGEFGKTVGGVIAELSGNLTPFDKLQAEIRDIDRALSGNVLTKPIKFLFTSDEDLRALRAQKEAALSALTAGSEPISIAGQGVRLQELQTQISALTASYDALFKRINSGASVADGTLAKDAQDADQLKKRIDALQAEARRVGAGGAAAAAAATPPAAKRALILGEQDADKLRADAKALAEARAAAAASLAKAESANRQAALEDEFAKGRISIQRFYDERLQIALKEIDDEIAAREKTLPQLEGADRARVQGELATLQEQRKGVEAANQRERLDSEKNLVDQLEALHAQLLDNVGQSAEARTLEIEHKYHDLIERLKAENNQPGLDLVAKLIDSEKAKASLDALQERIDRIRQAFQQAQQSATNKVETGELSQPAAQAEVAESARRATTALAGVRAELQGMAAADVPGASQALSDLDEAMGTISQSAEGGLTKALKDLRLEWANIQDAFAGEAVQNLRDGLTGFFKDLASGSRSAGEAIRDFARVFAEQMAEVAARALATYAVLQLLQLFSPAPAPGGAGGLGSIVGTRAHSGAIVGSKGGSRAVVPAVVFAGAARYHSGGLPGLRKDEVPIIAQRGEEILSRRDPRNVLNAPHTGGTPNAGPSVGVRIINAVDPGLVHNAMSSSEGEKVILNVIERNPSRVKHLLR